MKSRKPSRKKFATRLNRLMIRRGVDVNRLSRLTGIYPSTLHGYTNGNNFPTYTNLVRLRAALMCEWGDLFGSD